MAIAFIGAYDLTTQSNYFLQKYGPAAFDIYDSKFEALSQFTKSFDHNGNEFEDLIPSSLGGGKGSGTLPTPSNHETKRVKFGRKKMYFRAKVDREAIFAGVGDGAFEDTMKVLGARGPLCFSWNIERALWAPYATDGSNNVVGSGDMGTVSAVADSDPIFTLTCANTWLTARFEVGDVVNVGTGDTDEFEIASIDPDNTAITIERNGGSQVPATSDHIFMQGSEDNDILGIVSAAEFASGDSIYNEAQGYRWQSTRVNASSAGLTVELMDQVVHSMVDMTGVGIDLVMCHSTQWRKLSAQLEDQKRYDVMPKRSVEGALGWKGLMYVHPRGTAPVIISRFIPENQMFFLNTKFLRMKHARAFGWFRDTANTIWFPYEESDELQARFGGYMEAYIPPPFIGQLHTLAT